MEGKKEFIREIKIIKESSLLTLMKQGENDIRRTF